MGSKEFAEKFGELIKDIKVRKSIKVQKYLFTITSVLKAILVFSTAFNNHFA